MMTWPYTCILSSGGKFSSHSNNKILKIFSETRQNEGQGLWFSIKSSIKVARRVYFQLYPVAMSENKKVETLYKVV